MHAELVRLSRALHRAFIEGRGASEIEQALKEFESIARQDFLYEESTMRETGYPDYTVHRAEHEALARDIELLKEQLKAEGSSSALVVQTQRRIREWLVGHLNTADKALTEFLNGTPRSWREAVTHLSGY